MTENTEPLNDDEIITSGSGIETPAPQPSHDADGTDGGDADGTDGDSTDGTDGDSHDADGTDA